MDAREAAGGEACDILPAYQKVIPSPPVAGGAGLWAITAGKGRPLRIFARAATARRGDLKGVKGRWESGR